MTALIALALTVRALALPAHSTIDPYGSRALMAVSNDGAVAATVTVGGFETRAVLWNASGGWHVTTAPPLPPGAQSLDLAVAGFDGDALLANATASYGGSIRRLKDVAMRVRGASIALVDFGTCPYLPHSPGTRIAGYYADGDALGTMESQELVDINDLSGQLAPIAVRVRGSECAYLGNGSVLSVAGAYAAGYAGYVGNVPQAPDVPTKQHFVALRWHGDERAAIGAGAALAINAAGVAAGADTPPGPGSHYGASPHARLWPLSGTPVDLVDGPETSVAYAIDARGRVAGMLEDAGGRHRAFLWQDGRLRLLDDAVRVPGWRFECAYAIAANGAIAGIGVYRGTASAFLLEGL